MSENDVPRYRYNAALAGEIELAWQDRWEADGTFHTPNPVGELSDGFAQVADRPHLYVNDMFPYPSGAGLHVGHPLGFIGTDVFARYQRMNGHNVLHTMGFDAFGLPAEQYAVETGQHPRVTTDQNIATYRRQLRRLGLGHDQRRSVSTTDVDYYRWTQWIFLQIFNAWYDPAQGKARHIDELIAEYDTGVRTGGLPAGRAWLELDEAERRRVVDEHRLAYISEAPVNWCPGLGTVLANEEVTADGRSDRGNFPVFKRPLKQWMMRITAYADRLIADLDRLDWPDKVKAMQRNWIGRSEGALTRFATAAGDLEVFTTRPDTLFGVTFMVISPEHPMVEALTAEAWPWETKPAWTGGAARPQEAVSSYVAAATQKTDADRQNDEKDKTGVFTGSFATNPVTGQPVPVFVGDYVLMGYGTGAIMAVPGQDQRDWDFAEKFDLPIIRTVQPAEGFEGKAFLGDGPAINSAREDGDLDINGMPVAQAKQTVIGWLADKGLGEPTVTYKLRDWLFSRQRYWGEPFPIVYDETGLPIALPESQLPVELPEVDDFSPRTGDPNDAMSEPEPPLGRNAEWATVTLDLGDGPKQYRRELNTMPQWAGSCWYELRYLDPRNDRRFVDPENEQYWMGPRHEGDTGGVDLYVGGVEHAVLHLLYARFWHKVLFDLGHVSSAEPFRRLFNQGMVTAASYTDARGMYVPAADVVERDGAWFYRDEEVTRQNGKMGKSLKNSVSPDEMYELFGADTMRVYEMFTGPMDQSRPWETKDVVGSQRLLQRVWRNVVDEETGAVTVTDAQPSEESLRTLHKLIIGAREGMDSLRFNIAIAKLTELNNHITAAYPDGAPRVLVEPLVLMLAPLAPHISEELWRRLGHESSLVWEPYPVADESLAADDTIEIPVQVNGKVRDTVHIAPDADRESMEAAARASEKVAAQIAGKTERKVIVVPGKLVNFVVS
ncbi:leucine--tRNA ligase [Blastococcus sp. Marseille-P5729]|uniref:leucine--tRNA ligase n=1 Tax=Blastococcus sp. Marseille-P5729 TaxID=2086582 RepID=UPI000D10E24B|nr:leucine--tRNA ligase [Blastococcus sp. Marseille-P5729]